MFIDDHKKAAMTILSKRKKSGERAMEPTPMKAEEVKTEDGQLDGRHIAAQDMIAAHHEGSAQKLAEAMSAFIDMHHAKGTGKPETK